MSVQHSKYCVADEDVAIVGSANFTNNSLDKCAEFAIITRVRRVVNQLIRHHERMMMDGELLTRSMIQDSIQKLSKEGKEERRERSLTRRSASIQQVDRRRESPEPLQYPYPSSSRQGPSLRQASGLKCQGVVKQEVLEVALSPRVQWNWKIPRNSCES